jgi:sugar phosphate isomerase/epimerase
MAEIGEGNLNWSAIIDACDAAGVEYALVEQDQTYDRTPFEALEISYNNLREMGLS